MSENDHHNDVDLFIDCTSSRKELNSYDLVISQTNPKCVHRRKTSRAKIEVK